MQRADSDMSSDGVAPMERGLAYYKGRWMVGAGSSAPSMAFPFELPLGSTELELLVLLGQFERVAVRPARPEKLEYKADLPELGRPLLNASQRARFRRILKLIGTAAQRGALLELIASRGYAPHPVDWLPSVGDEVPDVFSPWADWVLLGKAHDEAERARELDEESWDMLYPGERLAAFRRMRRVMPERARSLLALKGVDVPAEHRVRLVAALAIGLHPDDVPLLDALGKDRSGKVKAVAAELRARIAPAAERTDNEKAYELASHLDRAAGRIGLKNLKTTAKLNRFATLTNEVTFGELAAALGVSGSELASQWDFTQGNTLAHRAWMQRVAQTAPDDALLSVVQNVVAHAPDMREVLAPASLRLIRLDMSPFAHELLVGAAAPDFASLCELLGGPKEWLTIERLMSSRAMSQLESNIAASVRRDETKGENDKDQGENPKLASELAALGLIAPQIGAPKLVEHFIARGAFAADPRLEVLRFNAELPSHPVDANPTSAARDANRGPCDTY